MNDGNSTVRQVVAPLAIGAGAGAGLAYISNAITQLAVAVEGLAQAINSATSNSTVAEGVKDLGQGVVSLAKTSAAVKNVASRRWLPWGRCAFCLLPPGFS